MITDANVADIQKRTIAQSMNVLRRRIDPQGTTEMTIAPEGDDRILLQIPGAKNVDDIKSVINKTANLSFHMVRKESNNEAALRLAEEKGTVPSRSCLFSTRVGRGPHCRKTN